MILQQELIEKTWFGRWFDSPFYHQLYVNHDEKEAAQFVDALVNELQPSQHSSMIDVGCGMGRHSRRLAEYGFNVTGIDLSFHSIKKAKQFESDSLHFIQHDMRDFFGRNQFDYVFNFFTSFGYFKTQLENYQVIRNMSRALKSDGTLVIDYMNVAFAADHLIADEIKNIDGVAYQLQRWMDADFIYKKISIESSAPEKPFEYTEQVARLTLVEFSEMFARFGLEIEKVFGDYKLNDFDSKNSPRLIMIAKKSVSSDKKFATGLKNNFVQK